MAALLGATIYLDSAARGRREVPAAGFATGYFSTVAEPDEMLTWVRLPSLAPGEGWGFVEFARRHGDFAMAGAAATLRLAPDGTIRTARAAALAVSDTPWIAPTDDLRGRRPAEPVLREWAATVTQRLRPALDGAHHSRLAAVALRRALRRAAGRAAESEEHHSV